MSEWIEEVKAKFGLSVRDSAPNEPELIATLSNFREVLTELKERGYNHLADLTAYDEFPRSPRFYMIYELISMQEKRRAAVVVPLADDESPTVPTICDLWAGANWLEREVFDLLGITFNGHPDLRRIYLPPSFKGHPLRKNFVIDYRQEFEKTLLEEGMFDPFGASIVRGSET